MEGRELAGSGLVPDQALCGYHSFPSIIKSVLLHKQKAWNAEQCTLASERGKCKHFSPSWAKERARKIKENVIFFFFVKCWCNLEEEAFLQHMDVVRPNNHVTDNNIHFLGWGDDEQLVILKTFMEIKGKKQTKKHTVQFRLDQLHLDQLRCAIVVNETSEMWLKGWTC